MRKPPKPNKTALVLLSLFAVLALLLVLYFAILAPIFNAEDPETPPTLETLPGEGVGVSGSTGLLFPQVERADMQSIRVYNRYDKKTDSYESYAFLRDTEDVDGDGDTNDFVIENFPVHQYSEEMFSALVVGVGYAPYTTRLDTLALSDMSEEERDATYADFGLSASSHPARYELTKTDGTVYTVLIGDKAPDGHYYARVEGRERIYVLASDYVEGAVMLSLESFVSPTLTFEADEQYAYMYIQNFSIFHDNTFKDIFFGGGSGEVEDVTALDPFVMFTYLPSYERDVYHAGAIYTMLAPSTSYTAHDARVDVSLQKLPGLTGTEVLKLGLSDADFAEGGLLENVAYTLYYEMPYQLTYDRDQNATGAYYVKNILFITHREADGGYTVGALSYREKGEDGETEVFYNMIAKVAYENLSFVEYKLGDWIEPRMFNVGIDDAAMLEISSAKGDYLYRIDGDGTLSQTVTELYSGFKYVYKGRDFPFEVNEQGYCEDIDQFRAFYLMLIQLHYEGAVKDDIPLTDEEIAEMMRDDSGCILSMTVTLEDGREMTYRFYPYSERHAMVALSGDGIEQVTAFYTLTSAVRRIADASWQLANGVYIDPDLRY
ncbi:MAG: DUF4340 domain-containing protein [Clostridia bacterium]|nr:DUF4340 domain-containing protein [Clostridia bacterium]